MTKQELAQKRNRFKFYVTGIFKPVAQEVMTEEESKLWNEIMILRGRLLTDFDKNSELKGLNVPPKCWCSKPAKYTPVSYPDGHKGLVCAKHINYDGE